MNIMRPSPSSRPGFSLVEVTLAIGIVGIAIMSLVGILGSTFQQVDDIMQTNRALAGVTRLVGALENPRSIISLTNAADTTATNTTYLQQSTAFTPPLDPDPANPASNFDLAYRLLAGAKDNGTTAVWLYVYERKVVLATSDAQVAGGNIQYNLTSNPSVMEVASCRGNNDNFSPLAAGTRNVVGSPMRVRLSLSKLLVGQRYMLDVATGEPNSARWATGIDLPVDPRRYSLAYLPVVAEFFPHDYVDSAVFKVREESALLVQNIVISR